MRLFARSTGQTLKAGRSHHISNGRTRESNMVDSPSPLHVVCAHCHRRNRIPRHRLADDPRCGACKRPVFSGAPVSLTDEQAWLHHVDGSDLPVVVDFWAAWCGPCRQLAPVYENAASRLEPRLRLLKVDVDALPAVANRWGIRSIPTLVAFRTGQEVGRQSGAPPPEALRQWLSQWALS